MQNVLRIPLMRHQKIALAWMQQRENGTSQPIGGILADDQGFGKTISTIALLQSSLAANRAEKKNRLYDGGTLIVCPPTLLRQWVQEIKSKSYDGINICLFHGPNKPPIRQLASSYDVVITSYSMCSCKGTASGQGPSTKIPSSQGPTTIFDIKWFRVVLDECQLIKNRKTVASRAVAHLQTKRRWCLSGTPLQNSLEVGPPPFSLALHHTKAQHTLPL